MGELEGLIAFTVNATIYSSSTVNFLNLANISEYVTIKGKLVATALLAFFKSGSRVLGIIVYMHTVTN